MSSFNTSFKRMDIDNSLLDIEAQLIDVNFEIKEFYEIQMHPSNTATKLNPVAANERLQSLNMRVQQIKAEKANLKIRKKEAEKAEMEEMARRRKETEKARRKEEAEMEKKARR